MNFKFGAIALVFLTLFSISVFAAPTVGIISPQNGATFVKGETITFEAWANDSLNDPAYNTHCGYPSNPRNDCFKWSAVSGGVLHDLGKGVSVNYNGLPTGEYTVFFDAVNTRGERSFHSVIVTIEDPMDLPPASANQAPYFTGLPTSVTIMENNGYYTILDNARNYVRDADDHINSININISYTTSNLSCRISTGDKVECMGNSAGTGTLTLSATDPHGTTGYGTMSIVINQNPPSNTPPTINLPGTWFIDNYGSYNELDLRNYSSDAEDTASQLRFQITSQSNSSRIYCTINNTYYLRCHDLGSAGNYNDVTVEVRDTSGATDRSTTRVIIQDTYYPPGSADLLLKVHNTSVDEYGTNYVTFYVENKSNIPFYVNNIRSYNYSSYITTSVTSQPSVVYGGESRPVVVRVSAGNVPYSRTETAYLEVRGNFSGRATFTKSEGFRVYVDKSGTYYPSSAEIEWETRAISMNENTTRNLTFYIKNNSNRTFFISSIEGYDNSSYISVQNTSTPTRVLANSREPVRVRITAGAVPTNRTETGYLKVTGRFSGESGYFTKTQSFIVYVDTETYNPPSADGVTVTVLPKSITLIPGQSESILVKVNNDSVSRKNIDISARSNSSDVTAELDDTMFSVFARDSGETILTVKAETGAVTGYYSIDVITQWNGKTDTQSISVRVESEEPLPEDPQPPVTEDAEIEVTQFPLNIEFGETETSKAVSVTMRNTSNSPATGVILSMQGLPEGMSFSAVAVGTIAPGETRTVSGEIKLENAEPGEYTAVLEVISSARTKAMPVTIKVSQAQGILPVGFFGLAEPFTLGIGAIIILALVVGLVYFAVKPKK
jgi:hypothetical protein